MAFNTVALGLAAFCMLATAKGHIASKATSTVSLYDQSVWADAVVTGFIEDGSPEERTALKKWLRCFQFSTLTHIICACRLSGALLLCIVQQLRAVLIVDRAVAAMHHVTIATGAKMLLIARTAACHIVCNTRLRPREQQTLKFRALPQACKNWKSDCARLRRVSATTGSADTIKLMSVTCVSTFCSWSFFIEV